MLAAATLPVPDDYRAGSVSMWLFTLWAGGFALLVLPYVVYRLMKHRDPVLLFTWIGGFICSLGEPMLDHLGHLWWPTNLPGPAFKGYDLSVPLLIPPCYVAFVAMTGYFAYRMFLRGVTFRQVFLVWLAITSTDFALELPGVITNVYRYYGQEPFYLANFPLHWGWLNGTGMLMVGFLLWALVPRLSGAKKLLVMLIPVTAFLGSYGMTSWPAFASLNSNLSTVPMALVDSFSLVLCLLVVWGVAEVVQKRVPAVSVERSFVGSLAGARSAEAAVLTASSK
ncbi:MAG: hypothetical protein ACREQ5_38910, partial [Candidatus Dormibacteria bacterium]